MSGEGVCGGAVEGGGVEGGGAAAALEAAGGVIFARGLFNSGKSWCTGDAPLSVGGVRVRGLFVRRPGEGVSCGKLDEAGKAGAILSREESCACGDKSWGRSGSIGGGFAFAFKVGSTLSAFGGVEVSS